MTAEEVRKCYRSTGEAYGKEPNEELAKLWINVLAFYGRQELEAALRRWPTDTTIEEFTGRPRGSRMPTPTELKDSMDRFRKAESAEKILVPCRTNGCIDGWIPFTKTDVNGKPSTFVKPCECRVTWRNALKARA